MIYLIGGAPRVGKSTLGELIQKRQCISCISTDVIRNLLDSPPLNMGIIQLEPNKRPEKFVPYFFQLLKKLQNHYPNYAVEGDIFTPEQVATLQESISLKCCFLGTSRITVEDLIIDLKQEWISQLSQEEKAKLSSRVRHGNWVSQLSPEEQATLPEQLIQSSKALALQAKKYNFPYYDMYPDREKTLELAYQELVRN